MQVVTENNYDRGFKFEGTKVGGKSNVTASSLWVDDPQPCRVTVEWVSNSMTRAVASVERQTMKGWESIGRYPAENCLIDGIPLLRPPTAREDLAIGTMVIGAKVLGADAKQVLAASGLKVVQNDGRNGGLARRLEQSCGNTQERNER